MNLTKKHILFFGVAAILAIAAKLWHRSADTADLQFLLAPTSKMTALSTGHSFTWDAELGYFNEQLEVAINKACAGLNFWVIAFLVFTTFLARYPMNWQRKWLLLPVAIVGAYGLTILANTSRIALSIKTMPLHHTHTYMSSGWFHEALGAFVYLFLLLLTYQLLSRLTRHEKSA